MYPTQSSSPSLTHRLARLGRSLQARRAWIVGAIMVLALLAFELFNYTTTDFALTDLLGEMRFMGLRWAAILSIAFCGMDFAGLARLFMPERGSAPRPEAWYLMAAWFLAAGMNALLTWWGVSLALLNHAGLGNEVLSRDALLGVVPVFVAALVVLIRVLIIGAFTMTGERLFTAKETDRPPLTAAPPAATAARPIPAAKVARPAPPPDDLDWDLDFGDPAPAAAEPRRMAPPARIVNRPAAPPNLPNPTPFRPAPKPAAKPVAFPGDGGHEINGRSSSEPR